MDSLIAIIGGGLAGCAAAALLARAGWAPALIERDTFPRDKLCGEFLSGESGRLLDEIGCLSTLLRHDPPRITHVNFIAASGRTLKVELPEPAFGISRRLLDVTLFEHACAQGAEGFTDCEVRSMKHRTSNGQRRIEVLRDASSHNPTPDEFRVDMTIGAYGRHARMDYNLDRPFVKHLQAATGFKLHHHCADSEAGEQGRRDLQNVTEIYGVDGGYCGVAMVEGGLVNVCMLLEKRALKETGSSSWPDIAAFLRGANPALAARLDSLVPVPGERVLSVSRMTFTAKEQAHDDDLLFIGDSAGMIAPLCGDGQAMALESGVRLANLLIDAFPKHNEVNPELIAQSQIGRLWQREWRSTFGQRMRIGRVLQRAMFRPAVADATIGLLNRSPEQVTKYLAQITRS